MLESAAQESHSDILNDASAFRSVCLQTPVVFCGRCPPTAKLMDLSFPYPTNASAAFVPFQCICRFCPVPTHTQLVRLANRTAAGQRCMLKHRLDLARQYSGRYNLATLYGTDTMDVSQYDSSLASGSGQPVMFFQPHNVDFRCGGCKLLARPGVTTPCVALRISR